MKQIRLQDFGDKAGLLLRNRETVAIEQGGRVVGYFMPVRERNQEKLNEDLDRLDRAVKKILVETGWTEDEFADMLDLNKPAPFEP